MERLKGKLKKQVAQGTNKTLPFILPFRDASEVEQEIRDITSNQNFDPFDRFPAWKRLRTGCPSIDAITNGGIPLHGLTEIVGGSGSGKTQLCLQLSLMVQSAPPKYFSTGKAAVYICTEDVFPAKRLHQLADLFAAKYGNANIHFEDNVFIEHIADFEQLNRCLFKNLPGLLAAKQVGLVIVDSIAGLFRSENCGMNFANRSLSLAKMVSNVLEIGGKHGFAVVCVNQVADNPDSGLAEPCLGLAWSNLVTTRLSIARNRNDATRRCEIVFGPDLRSESCDFRITPEGVV